MRAIGGRQVGLGDWSSQPTNPDWSEDQTTAKWTPQHVHAVRWPKRRPANTPQSGVAEISRVVAAPARWRSAPPVQPAEDQAAALRSQTRLIWTYSATAAVAVFLALMSSHALLGLFGQAVLPRASASASVPARVAPAARAIKRKLDPSVLQSAATPQPSAASQRRRSARSHARSPLPVRATAASPAEADTEVNTLDPNIEPDMSFMDAPITPREARAIAEGRARTAGQAPLEAQEPGTLRINSRPWSQLYVDGRLVGNTPQLGLRVSAGEHSLRLVNPQFEMSKTFSIFVGAGETVTRIESLDE